MKSVTLIYCGVSTDAAKAMAVKIRADGGSAQLRSAETFDVSEQDAADRVIIQPDVTQSDRARIEAAYGDKVQRPVVERTEKPKLTLPPAPAAPVAAPQTSKGK